MGMSHFNFPFAQTITTQSNETVANASILVALSTMLALWADDAGFSRVAFLMHEAAKEARLEIEDETLK